MGLGSKAHRCQRAHGPRRLRCRRDRLRGPRPAGRVLASSGRHGGAHAQRRLLPPRDAQQTSTAVAVRRRRRGRGAARAHGAARRL